MQSQLLPCSAHRRAPLLVRSSLTSRHSPKRRNGGTALRSYHAEVAPVKALTLPKGHTSILPLIHSCNNLVLPPQPWASQAHLTIGTRTPEGDVIDKENVVPFVLSHAQRELPVGFIRPHVAAALEEDHQKHLVSGSASPWDLKYTKEHPKQLKSAAFAAWVNEGGKYTRTMHMERLVYDWRKHDMFPEILKGWNDEAYPVYSHPPKDITGALDPIAFAIERAALPLFGLVNFGALLTAYVHDPANGRSGIWIPRRSLIKRTWPGMLDVTAGGGMGLGDTAMETILRESAEEALLDHDYLKEFIRPVGVLPFPNRSPKGWILPGMYCLFDLPLPSDFSIIPKINALDGEVEQFDLLEPQQVLQYLLEGKFKSSSALALIDFLIRHGYITEDTDPRYLDICRYLKADIHLPVAWRPAP